MSAGKLKRLFIYTPPDPIAFWRKRAGDPGWLSVMWANPAYNELADRDQWSAIERNLPAQRQRMLDLGCGTGRLAARLASLFDRYEGVDLDTMVEEARRRNPDLDGKFVAASVQQYVYPEDSFDMVLSMGCLSTACRAEEMPDIARRIIAATRSGGKIVLIDPFHRVPALVRTCRMSAKEVIRLFESLGATLDEWTGIHFIPARLLLARRQFARPRWFTRAAYYAGEAIERIAPRLMGDYQVIAFTKK